MPGIYYKTALLLIFFGQGIIFSAVLLVQFLKSKDQSLKWLSILIFLACLYVTPWMLGHAGWYGIDGYREFLFFVPFQQLFLFGPIIYFYIQSLLKPGFSLVRKDYLHLILPLLYFVYSLIVFITDYWILDEFYFYEDGRDKDLSPWYQILGTFIILAYTLASFKDYRLYKTRILNEVSYADSIKYTWLSRFLLSLIIILSLRILFMIGLPEWGSFGLKWWYYFAFSCIFYYITFAGYTNGILASLAYNPPILPQVVDENEPKELISSEVESWTKKIDEYVNGDQAFKNPRLTLQDVAQKLKTNPRIISQSINQGLQMNFNDYINEARLSELKARLDHGDHLQFTLLSLALDCGFNSKSTFNRAFKNKMGVTPLVYIKNLEK